jgi:hypothetical protein
VFELLEELEGEPTDVYIVHLTTGNVTVLTAPPFYSAHHANAYETSEVNVFNVLNDKNAVVQISVSQVS